jgi:SEC-C motif
MAGVAGFGKRQATALADHRHLHDEDGDPIIDGNADDIGQLRRESTELIGPCVVLIDRFWKARRRPPGGKPKPGRNDPCPCGSDRKYKRCCVRQLDWPMAFGSEFATSILNLVCGRRSRVERGCLRAVDKGDVERRSDRMRVQQEILEELVFLFYRRKSATWSVPLAPAKRK